jgi:hypothetical protein
MLTKAADSELNDTGMYLECSTILVGEGDLGMVLMENGFIYLRKIIFPRIKMHKMCNYAV